MPSETDPVARLVREEIERGSFPGAAWAVEERGRVLSGGALGLRAILPREAPAGVETIYDLASLTKPLATASLLAILQSEGSLRLDAPVALYFPELAGAFRPTGSSGPASASRPTNSARAPGPGVTREPERPGGGDPTLLDLALHCSGLPSWRPLYAIANTPAEMLTTALALQPVAACGEQVVYSDPGYILLGEILHQVAGKDLSTLFQEKIAGPLGLTSLSFLPVPGLRDRIAPTELGNRYELEIAARLGVEVDPSRFRQGMIHGEVHDGNAWALGGAAGNAGLFGDVGDVVRLAREFLGSGSPMSGIFEAHALGMFRSNMTPGLEEGRSLGWKLAVQGAREAEGVLSPQAFGHSGFTGTSLWIDPSSKRIFVLLTNRVHPEVRPIDMTAIRRRFHESAQELA